MRACLTNAEQIVRLMKNADDTNAVRAFLKHPAETFPGSVVAAILEGAHPIKAFREYRGMTQARLAQAVGSSAVYISQIERGGRRAGRRFFAKLGKALGVEADVLVRNED